MSSGVLALKNGSSASAGQDACATPWRAVHRSILPMSPTTSAGPRSARSATGPRTAPRGARPAPLPGRRGAARLGAGERHAGGFAGGVQTRDEIERQERRIARGARDPFEVGAVAGKPVERGEDDG